MFLVFLGKIVNGDNRDCKTKEATALAKAPLLLEILGSLTRIATYAEKSGCPFGYLISLISEKITEEQTQTKA